MAGRSSSFALYRRWAALLLVLVSYFAPGETVLCVLCSYTYTGVHYGYECVNATEDVKTASIVNCKEFCRDVVVYKRHENNQFVVSSISRGCLLKPHTGPNCTQSVYERTCTFVCEGEKCNNQDLSYREPPKSDAMTSSTHWTLAAMALTALLLNLIF